jgi:hypothetical protein
MSRVIAPAEADVPVPLRPAFDAAGRRPDFVPTMHHARAAGPNTLHGWLDVSKAMSTSWDAPARGGAHRGEEVDA